MKKTLILLFVVMLLGRYAYAQQDPQFTQYLFNGIYINPAYTGYKGDLFIQSCYRSQWTGVTGAPRSFALAADGAIHDQKVGLGLLMTNDQIGAQNTFTAYANYAYRIPLGMDEDASLAFGLSAGMMQLGIDGSKLNPVTSGDQAIPVGSQNLIIPDASFGTYFANEKCFAGISATNLLGWLNRSPVQASLLVPIPKPHFYLTGGMLFDLRDEMKLKPEVIFKDDLRGPTTLDLDLFMLMNERISFGAFYRTAVSIYPKPNLQRGLDKQDAFGAITEIFIGQNLRVGYSYDHSLNNIVSYNSGTHEFSIGFYLDTRGNVANGRRCYQF